MITFCPFCQKSHDEECEGRKLQRQLRQTRRAFRGLIEVLESSIGLGICEDDAERLLQSLDRMPEDGPEE